MGGKMQLESRVRRQREFLTFLLEKFAPKCYWCDKVIDKNSFNLSGGGYDGLLVHHIDEDRDHNLIENRTLIHATCHQQLHKVSTEMNLSPAIVRAAKIQQETHA
jgi:hypothetical protein